MNTLNIEMIFSFVLTGGAITLLILVISLRKVERILTGKIQPKQEEADAVIIDMAPTGLYINSLPQIKLQMQVLPDKGRSFIMETNYVVASRDLENYKSGNKLKVKYFPEDHHRKPLIA